MDRDLDLRPRSFFSWEVAGAGDFPYYRRGAVSPVGWLMILLGVFLGFTLDLAQSQLVSKIAPTPGVWQSTLSILCLLLVPALPMLGVYLAVGRRTALLFRRMRGSDWLLAVILAAVALVWSIGVTLLLGAVGIKTVSDSAIPTSGGKTGVAESVGTILQFPFLLFGENLFLLLPFLFFLMVLASVLGMPRKPAVIVAVLLAGALFGMYHFRAYDWHLAQMLLVIGAGQVIVAFGYLRTKNILVPFISHLLIDTTIFLVTLVRDLH